MKERRRGGGGGYMPIYISLSLATLQSNCQNIFELRSIGNFITLRHEYKMSTKSSKSSIISVASQEGKASCSRTNGFLKKKNKTMIKKGKGPGSSHI